MGMRLETGQQYLLYQQVLQPATQPTSSRCCERLLIAAMTETNRLREQVTTLTNQVSILQSELETLKQKARVYREFIDATRSLYHSMDTFDLHTSERNCAILTGACYEIEDDAPTPMSQ